ncbi:TPA: WxL domain-containing protein [Enterococcus faecalis]
MKQTKWQRLATIGLCSSLVINAFSGVTAIAETVTSESSPTVANSIKEATPASSATQESTESSQETTETSREEVEKTETTESANVAADLVDERENEITSIHEVNSIQPKAAVAFPEKTYQFGFVNEAGQLINPANIPITYDYAKGSWTPVTANLRWTMVPGSASTVGNLKNVTMPASSIATPPGPTWVGNTEVYANFSIEIPRYYSSMSLYDRTGKINPTYPLPSIAHIGTKPHTFTQASVITWLGLTSKGNNMYGLKETNYTGDPAALKFPIFMMRLNEFNNAGSLIQYTTVNRPIYYHLTNRRVTENFVDTSGAKITPPTGFTQGKQTVIDSDPYTFKQSGTLPETYKASNGKTYKFKGWYKGKTKPNTLTTTKAPSYAVTYDDNDDLNVVYEEIEVFDFPALTYQFGFVDESGKRVDASTIKLTYDNWHGEGLATNSADSNKPDYWKTVSLEKGQVAPTKNNLKEIAYPAQSLEILSDRSTQHSAANLTFTLPNYYEKISVYNKSGTFDIAYPFPNIQGNDYSEPFVEGENKLLSRNFELKNNGSQSFIFNRTTTAAPIDIQVPSYLRKVVHNPNLGSGVATYLTIDKPVYYYLTNRKVTENFVDTNGTKITPPTGFTQGKQTVINSDPYTFKQSGTLPDTYQADGKTYKFKGWYKGKSIINTLTTTKAPSYAVTYNDDDDLNVVYEEVTETAVYPGFYAQFVDEQGKAFTNPLTLSGNYTEYLRKTGTTVFETKGVFYPMTGKRDTTVTNKYKIETTSSVAVPNNYWTAMPADIANRGYALNNLDITNQMKYVDKIETTDTYTTAFDYTEIADIGVKLNYASQRELNAIDKTFVKQADNTFAIKSIWGNGTFSQTVPRMLVLDRSGSVSRLFGFDGTPDYKHTMNYTVTRKQVTENFVDTNGTKITPPTGFTQGNQIPMTSNTFKYTAAKALPATYTAGGKTYTFQGWYKGKTKPNTLTTSTTPTYNTTFDGNDDMTAMYKEEVPKASVALTRTTAETVTSGGNVTWRATITNTSQAPLTTATIKKSTAWTTGLAAPTAMIVTPAGGTAKTVPVTATTWTNGVSLGTDIPAGKSATVQFTTKATGTAGQVLRAGITTSGNYSGVSASATVRVKDNDQAIVTPTAEGFISVPTFNFGQVGVAGSTQQHGLKKAADYYGNGTRNPYLRIKKTQPNWSLTAQLSQPKSATDSLPTVTRLLLGAAPVSSFSNYNQPTELKNAVGTTSAISLNANNTATRIIANQQFTGSNIYQLDFTFNNVKLQVPANQGVKGQQYQAAVTWNLVTGP